MLNKLLFILSLLLSSTGSAQLSESELVAQPVGGSQQAEQVIETQLTLPKVLLTPQFDVHVTTFFDLDSAGNAVNVSYKGNLNNALRKETTRILQFIKFKRTQSEGYETYPYHFTYHISTERYNKLLKQKSKFNLKKPLPADSSFMVYARAQKSPEYFKNAEEGLAEYLLSEIEYPKLAIEKSIEGTVVLDFIVETNGYVTAIHVKQGVNAGCTEEAIRLIKGTKWIPASLNNKFVRYSMSYPITFALRNITKDSSSSSVFGQ